LKAILEDDSRHEYATLLTFQRYLNQKGNFCLLEMARIMLDSELSFAEDGSLKIENVNSRTYEIDLSGLMSEDFLEKESFLKRLLTKPDAPIDKALMNANLDELAQQFRRDFCKPMRSGYRVLFLIKEWHRMTNSEEFLDWFVTDFWPSLIEEINRTVLPDYGRIRIVAALLSRGKLDSPLPSNLLCQPDCFSPYRLIDIPLPCWRPDDLEPWLMDVQGLKRDESRREAQRLCDDSDGIPAIICSTLMERYGA
jgi:hypothetical protein